MISLYDILESAQGQLFGEPVAQLFDRFCVTSHRVEPSNLYVALKSDAGDGHYGMMEAVERGATGILCARPPDFDTEGISIILVRDPLTALMQWSHTILGKFGTQVIGVSGITAKSVAVEAIRHLLSIRYSVTNTVKTDGNGTGIAGRLNIPMTLAHLTAEDRAVILELDPTQPGEMSEMVGAVRPHVGVITGLGYGFSERFDSPESFTNEIGLLLDYLSPTGLAVINYDDDRARLLIPRARAGVVTVGIDGFGADMMAYNIVVGTTRTGFDLRFRDARWVGRWTPTLGKHQLTAILCALAVGDYYEVPIQEALRALTEMQPLPGRMKPLEGINGSLLIDDSYKAEPGSTLALLEWLSVVASQSQRTIFLMGDMDNLGIHTQRAHRWVGQRAADTTALFITQGTEAAGAGRAALDAGMEPSRVAITYSPQDAVARLRALSGGITESDILVVKGGISARMELVVRELLASPENAGDLPRASLLAESSALIRPMRPSWVEVDLEALGNNVRALKRWIGEDITLFAVVKADAYGHGAVAVARTALLNGADHLAVASMSEALELRETGISAPILVMSYTPVSLIRQAIRGNITITLYDLELARAYDRAARESGGVLKVHVKIDTGMGRLGVMATQAIGFFRSLLALTALEVEGVYTHFSMADEDPNYTAEQVKTFKSILAPLRASGYTFTYVHAANSAGTLASRDNHFNAVRVGIALYGISPSEKMRVPDDFQPVLAWRTVIAQVKTIPEGHPVGYGHTFIAPHTMQIAIIPVGYADGLRRAPNHWGSVLVHGEYAPIIGRVGMEKTVIDVTHLPLVAIGDEVTLLGRQGHKAITAEDAAAQLGTISYEVVTNILARVPRA